MLANGTPNTSESSKTLTRFPDAGRREENVREEEERAPTRLTQPVLGERERIGENPRHGIAVPCSLMMQQQVRKRKTRLMHKFIRVQ